MAGNIPMGSMSTEIKLNGSQSVRTLRELKQAVTQATSAWKAQRAELSTIGKSAKAVEAKYKGLAETINKQKDYISGLREAQKHLQEAQKSVDRSTREGRQEYGKYNEALQKNETRLHSAQQKLAGLTNQQSKAHKSLDYYKSGLADVQKQLKSSESVAKSYVVRLKAEGKGYESAKAKLNSYKNSLTNLKKQQSIQTQELSRIAKETGKSSDAYKRQEVRVNQTATSIAKLNGKIKSSQTEVNKLNPHGFNKLANGAKHVTNAADKMKSSFKHAWDNIKTGATAAAAGIGAVGAATISGAKKAGNLQQTYKEITNLAVTGGEKQREAIKNVTAMQRQGRDMSIKYGKSQQDIAEAFEDLVKRGYTTKQALGAMKTELQASVASGDDFKDVVSVSSTVLESFGMRAKTVTQMTSNTKRAVNELAYAADMTSTGFKDLGYGMSYVGSSAHQAGFNLSETASAMGILSNNGLEASKAGTGLNQVINRLSDATGKLVKGDKKNVLAQLGIKPEEITDSTGKLRNLATVFGVLNKHMKGMTKIQKINIMKSLFGMSGEQAGLILAKYNKQLGSLSKNVLKAGKDGKYVADLSAKNSQTAKMQMARLKQAGNAFTMTLGAKMLPAINEAGNSLVVFLTKSKDGKRLTNDFAKAVEGLAIGLANTIKLIAHHRAETKIIATGLGAAYGVVKLASLVQWLNKTRLALQGLNVVSHIAGGFKKVGSVLKVTGSLFKATGKTMGRSFVHQLGLISKGIKGLGSGILKAAKAIGSKALSAGKLIGSKITQGIKATTKFSMGKRLATGALAGAAVATPEAINAVKDRHSANKRSQDIGGAVGALAGGTLTSMIPVVGPMLAPVGAIIGKYTGRWGGQAVNNFTKGWQKNKPPKKFWSLENLGYSAHNMWNGFMKGVTNTIKWFKKNWKEVGLYFVSPLAGAINSLYKHNKGFHKWVNSLVKSFKNAWKGIGKWFGNIGKSIQKSWKGMPKWFTKLGKNMSKGIKSSWKGVTKWFSNVGKDIQKAWKGMTKWFTKLGKNMAKGLKSAWKSMVKWFSDIAEDIKKAWRGMTSWFTKLGKNMAKGLKSAWKGVTKWFSDIGKGIRNAWRGMTSWFSHLGSNMASGIKSGWHGMTSWFTNLAKSIKSVFDHLWSGIKDGAASTINTIIDDINGTGKNISNFTHGKIKFGKIEHVHFYQGTGPIKNPILGVLNDGNDSPATGNREGLLHKNGLLEVLNGTNIKRLLLPGDEVIKASDMASLFHFADGTVTPATNLSSTPAGLSNQNGLDLLINITDDILQAITGETVSNFTPTKTVIPGINSIRSTPVATPFSKSPINNKNSDKTGKPGKSPNTKDKADIKGLKEQTAEMQKAVVVSKQFVKSIASVEKQVKALYTTLKKNPFGKYISSQATKAVKALKGKGNFAKVIKSMNSKMSKDIKKTNSANLKNIKSFSSSMIKTFKSLSSDIKKIWSELWSYTDKKFESWRKDELSDESSFKSKFTHGWKSMDSGIKSEFNHFWSSMVTTAGRGVNTVIKVLNEAIGRIDSVISDFGGSKNAVSKSSYVHYAKGTDANGRLTHDTLAIVNDAQSGPRQEAVVTDTNDIILPKGNNVPMVLRKGWGILDGTQTQSLGLPHFANGTGLKALYEIAKHNWNHPVKTGQNMFSAVSGLTGAMKELASGMRSKSEDSGVNWWSQLWKMVEDKVNDGVPAKGLLKAVEKYGEGHKYVWGADGPSAFDCSGLVMYALRKRYGIDFPHYSGAQYARTEHISKRNAKMGDLVFWGAGGSDHVGVYAGGNKYFSAESPSQGIHMNTLSSVVGKGSPLFGRVKGLKQDDGSSSEVKANNALQRHIKSQVGKGFWKTVNKIAEKFGAAAGSIANPAGDGVQRWAPIVEKALRVLHLSSSLKSKVLRQIATESSGDPHAMGGTDGLSDGHAEGLMQVKPPTFASYHLSGHNNIWNGFDNMLAGLNYAKHRYGSNLSGLGMGHGYANGGLASAPSIFGEAGPEMAIPLIPSKSTRAWELIGKAIGILSANSNFNNQQQVNVKEQKEEHDFRQAVLLLLNEIAGKSDVAKVTLTTPAGRALWEVVEPYSKQEQRAEQIRERRGLSGRFR